MIQKVVDWFKGRCKHFRVCAEYMPCVLCDKDRIGKQFCRYYEENGNV